MAVEAAGTVKLVGMWASAFALRVEWALKLKGVEYEYASEVLPHSKSEELPKLSPKTVPVLVHGGKAVSDSLLIIEYIEEVWHGDGYCKLLPEDPYERAMARFWARFAEDKFVPLIYAVFYEMGEEQSKAVEGIRENLKILGCALKGKKFFGGEDIGYLDIAVGWIPYFLQIIEKICSFAVIAGLLEVEVWAENFLALEVVKERLPPWDKLCEFIRKRREGMIAAKSHD